MFAYCENNPINCTDLSGLFPVAIGLAVLAIGLAVGLTGCATKEEKEWPDNCIYEYWEEGAGPYYDNCYGFVFDYWAWSAPGQYGYPNERDWTVSDVVYTKESMIHYVKADAVARDRKVEYLSSPDELPEGALLVACKLSSDGTDYHFAVRIPNGAWLDKPGKHESRYNKIDGFAKVWEIGENVYTSPTIYFAYFRNGGS